MALGSVQQLQELLGVELEALEQSAGWQFSRKFELVFMLEIGLELKLSLGMMFPLRTLRKLGKMSTW